MILCKLTDQQMKTHNGFQWALNELPLVLDGEGDLCGPGFYHCYEHPLLAVLLNPIHANISNPRLFRIMVPKQYESEPQLDGGLKRGYRTMSLVEELPVPKIRLVQRVAFGILCAKEVSSDAIFRDWADKWLSGEDRTIDAVVVADAAVAMAVADVADATDGVVSAVVMVVAAAVADAADAAVAAAVAANAWGRRSSKEDRAGVRGWVRERVAAAWAWAIQTTNADATAWEAAAQVLAARAVESAVRTRTENATPLNLIAIAEKAMTIN